MTASINILINIMRGIIIAAISVKVATTLLKCQTGELSMAAAAEKAKRVIKAGIIACVLPEIIPVLANNYFNPSHVNSMLQGGDGAKKLINAFLNVVIALEVPVTVFYAMKELMLYKVEPDEYGKVEQIKKARNVVIIGIVIITITSTINTILSYYT